MLRSEVSVVDRHRDCWISKQQELYGFGSADLLVSD